MTDWSKILTEDPKTKKIDWGALLEGPKLSSSIPAPSSLTPIVKPEGDLPQFEVPKLKPIDPTGKEIFTQDINVFRSYEEGLRQKNQRVGELVDYGLDMYDNNPIKVLTMTEDDGIFRPSKTRLNKALKEQFGDGFDNEMFEQSVVDMKKRARSLLGNDWASRYYHNAEKSIDQSFDLKDSINERITQDAYEYVSSKGMFDETDQKRAEINLQIKAEQDKSIEEGRDPLKIQALRSKLSALGESYIDEDGNVIDPKTKTPEQEEYISSVQRYKEQHSISDEDKLKEAFYNTYKFTRSIDELYEMDAKPWLDQQISIGAKPGAYPHVLYMPKDIKSIIDQRREAHAELTALSKLYLANSSPLNVKKDFKYFTKDALSSLSSGFFSEPLHKALKDQVGPTERDVLDAIQEVSGFNGLPLTDEMQNRVDRSVLDYVNEGAFSMVGMLPALGMAGRSVTGLRTLNRLETLYNGWQKGNVFTKTAAHVLDLGIEELKLQLVGFQPGSGLGFGVAGKITPQLLLKNPVANGLFQMIWKPATISSAVYLSRVTEAAAESLLSYKPFGDLMQERFGDLKEVASVPLSMLMFGFGGAKKTTPERYQGMKILSERLREKGDISSADWLDKQVKVFNAVDKAVSKVKTKGKTAKEIAEEQDIAADQAFAREVAVEQIKKEDLGEKERTIAPEKLPVFLRGSKMKDKEGKPQVWYHKTNAVFNIFSPREKGPSNVKNIEGLNWFSTDPEFGTGTRLHERYLNLKNPAEVGNVGKLTKVQVEKLKKTNDGIHGYIVKNGERVEVAATFETKGVVRVEPTADPFKERNSEILRRWSDQLRNTKVDVRGLTPASILPINLQKAAEKSVKIMADVLKTAANALEVLEKGFDYIKTVPAYVKLSPELKERFDPEIRKRLQKALEDALPEATFMRDVDWAKEMEKDIRENYLPVFEETGKRVAEEHGGRFISDVKTPESIATKKRRQGLMDIRDVPDVMRGAILLKDLKDFKAVEKQLKKEGYSLHNKRAPDKQSGYRGIFATKREGDLGVEIQLHTEKSWELQEKAHEIYKKYRDRNIEKPEISKIEKPETYIEDQPKKGSINLNDTEDSKNDKFSQPHSDYSEANGAAVHSNAKNLWIKPDGPVSNEGRVLMMQFTSRLMGIEAEQTSKSAEYYTALYKEVPGYHRTNDFWEIPQWQAVVAGSFKNADSYIIRDIPEAVEFIKKSGYKELAFSVLDVTKENVKALAEQLPDVKFNVGGYIENFKDFFKETPNVKVFDSVEDMAKDHGVPYTAQYDYRHFKNTKIIPRLSLSTGCKYRCAFCTVEKKVIDVDKNVIDSQVESLKDFKADIIYLNDKTFGQAKNYRYLEEIYKKLKEDNPNFQGFVIQTTALDFANRKKFDPEFLKNSGIRFVELGVETYNDDILADLNKKHSSKKYVDEAMQNARENGVMVIPNIIVGIEQETARSYENTLKFLKDNADVISHANIYSLAIYEGTELANEVATKVDADRNENVVQKSFHTNPKLHEQYMDKFLDWSKAQVEKMGPAMRYEQDMAESRRLFDEAYAELEDINLEGSPALKPHERKMKALELPTSVQRELKKSWTQTKDKLLGELKGKKDETKKAFADFINTLPLTGLNIKLKSAMLKKVNAIDFTKPSSLRNAITYFDNVVEKAAFRATAIEFEKTLNDLDYKTSEQYITRKNTSGVLKNKFGPSGLPLYEELKSIRDDMLNKDWAAGQAEIEKIQRDMMEKNRDLTAEEYDKIARLGLWGMLNSTNGITDLEYLKGRKRDFYEILKSGRTKIAADKFLRASEKENIKQGQFGVLTGFGKKPVELNEKFFINKVPTNVQKALSKFSWPGASGPRNHIDWLSQNDKTSEPGKSFLNETLIDPIKKAHTLTYVDGTHYFNKILDKAKEIYGLSGRALSKQMAENTEKLYTIKFKDITGTEKELDITLNQAIKKYMEFEDPTLEGKNEKGGYMRDGELTDLGQKIVDLLTPEAKTWAEWQLNEFYPEMREYVNEMYRQIYGIDMPYNAKYSPIYASMEKASPESVTVDDMLAENYFTPNINNRSLIARVKNDHELKLVDSDQVLQSYVSNMTYWKNWVEPVQLWKNFIYDRDIRAAIKQNFLKGDRHIKILESYVDRFTNRPTNAWKMSALTKVQKNFMLAALSLKLPVGLKQMTAAPAFAEYIPIAEIPKYMGMSLTKWGGKGGNKELFEKFMKDPGIQQRYKSGWDMVVTDIMAKDLHSVGDSQDWRHALMFPTKYGDMASVLLGAFPVYRYHYDQALKEYGNEKLADLKAMETVREAIESTQQSGAPYELSFVQNDNPLFKAMTMFQSAPMQYNRKVMAAARNWAHGRGTWQQHLKDIAIYHVLLPSFFQFASNGFRWDDEDQIRAASIGNFNSLFALGDLIDGALDLITGEPWKTYHPTPFLSTWDEIVKFSDHVQKIKPSLTKELDGLPEEYKSEELVNKLIEISQDMPLNYLEMGKALKNLSVILGNFTGYPVAGVTSMGKGIYDVATGAVEGSTFKKALRILGWSDYALYDRDNKDIKEIEKLLNDTTQPTLKKIEDKAKQKDDESKKIGNILSK